MRVEIISDATDIKTENSFPKRKVAGYARVSAEKDEQFPSYEAQIMYYSNYIKNHHDWEYAGIYTDEGLSGTSITKRIGFQKMIKDALKGKIDLIITKSISRFARNTLDSLMTIRKLKEKGVEVYFEKENIWTLDSKGELLITIMSSIAQEESRSISMNVTWGIRQSMKQGQAYVPYKVFLGYEKDSSGQMVINEEQAKIVRTVYGLAIRNTSPYNIAKIMESNHIPFSPNIYKWYPSTIRSILRNEKYKGDALRQKTYSIDYLSKQRAKNRGDVPQYYIHNHHPAIIDPAIFDRLSEYLNDQGKDLDYKRSKSYLFSKKIKCTICGSYFGPVEWRHNSVRYWRCNNRYKKRCISPTIKETDIKNIVINALNNRMKNQKEAIFSNLNKIFKNSKAIKSFLSELSKRSLMQEFNDNLFLNSVNEILVFHRNYIVVELFDESIFQIQK